VAHPELNGFGRETRREILSEYIRQLQARPSIVIPREAMPVNTPASDGLLEANCLVAGQWILGRFDEQDDLQEEDLSGVPPRLARSLG
jgi:hypothetical protein